MLTRFFVFRCATFCDNLNDGVRKSPKYYYRFPRICFYFDIFIWLLGI